ncbi:SLC13 family permease, partial [Pseudidiomarina sp.]|uniref:SLC13 family permease n=1 Tax=Pseudidiomarina sp. TaxID=2081707 RepID=UPI00299E94AB
MTQLYVALVIVCLFAGLVATRTRPATLFVGAAIALYLPGLLSAQELLNHYVNLSLITLMLLLIGSMALERTRALQWVSRKLFHKSQLFTLLRMMGLVSFTSAFLNNTAVVAALMSAVRKNREHAAQRLLIPLSYFAIFGGMLTLIGTSTNLVVNSFLVDQGHPGFQFFDFLPIGLGVLGVAGATTIAASYFLPKGKIDADINHDYFLDAKVNEESPFVGKTVQQAGLRALDGLFMAEIIRHGNLISPVKPETLLQANDRLVFCGDVKQAQQLSALPGVTMFAHEAFTETNGLLQDNLTEVIVSPTSTLVGRTLKQANFRALFDAAVVAIGRGGARISGKLGQVEIKAGDRLVLATSEDFYRHHNLERNFFLLEGKRLSPTLNKRQEAIAILGFIGVVTGAATQTLSLFNGLIIYLALILASSVITGTDIRRRLPLDIWLVIGSALCIADVFITSGLAGSVSSGLFSLVGTSSVWVAFVAVFFLTLLTTEIVTNNAAAAIVFPIAVGLSQSFGADIMPFVMAVAFGASASFISPYGYQTNLMVMNAGNYKFSDFSRIGVAVAIAYSVSALYL